jgi:hypothetical protein
MEWKMKFSFLVFFAMIVGGSAFAESAAFPGPGIYRGGAPAQVRQMGYPGSFAGGPVGVGQGSHGINTLAPLRAGVRAGLQVQGRGRPCAQRCGKQRCGGQRCIRKSGCSGRVRCMSVQISMGGCRGGGMGRCGRVMRGCRRRC